MPYLQDVRSGSLEKTTRMRFSWPLTISMKLSISCRAVVAAGRLERSYILSSGGCSSCIFPEHLREKECI